MALVPVAAAVVDAMKDNGFTGFAKLGVERASELVDAMSRPGSRPEYAAHLEDAGVATEVLRFGGVFHGFIQMPGLLSAADEATAAITAHLADVFR